MNSIRTLVVVVCTAVMALILGGCASPANRVAMEAGTVARAQAPKGSSIQVNVSGAGSPAIADSDLKAAIETSLIKAALFSSVNQTPAEFSLSARIIEVQIPPVGYSFTVTLEIAWQLVRASDQKVLFRKSIRSEHTTGALESFAGVTRKRMAIEGAAKKNIETFLQDISVTQF